MHEKDEAFFARRAAARAELDALDPAMGAPGEGDPLRKGWFEAVYARAGDDPARVPWANLEPHPLVKGFVDLQLGGLAGLEVLDVGCGLGDNAEYYARHGAKVEAFDFVADAVEWAKRRFPQSRVSYGVADLFKAPASWAGRFDFVNECYTLQALEQALVPEALAALAACLKPSGCMLLVARARDAAEEASGPPWPLARSVFDAAAAAGLRPVVVEDFAPADGLATRHWRALLRRELS